MAKLIILDHTGHTPVLFDNERALAGDSEAQAAVKEAERIFKEKTERGHSAFRTDVSPAEKLKSFDPAALEITLVPRLAGGA